MPDFWAPASNKMYIREGEMIIMREKLKNVRVFLLFLFFVFLLVPVTGKSVEAAAKPKLAKKSVNIVIGGTAKIKIKNTSKRAKITYKSTRKSIAAVSKRGKVKGKKNGTAKILVFVKSGSKTTKLKCKVNVKKPKMAVDNMSLIKGSSVRIAIKNKPKKAEYTWFSSNPNIVSINKNGELTAKSVGEATIKVKVRTPKKTYSLSCRLTVKPTADNSNNQKPTVGNTGNQEPTYAASLNNLVVDEIYWAAGEDSDITFTVEGKNISSPVILYNDENKQIAEMNDDGIHGDVVANDGIYTYVLNTIQDASGTEIYYASTENIFSNNIKVFYFEKPTENTVQEMKDIQTELNDIEVSFLDADGFVEENKIDDVLLAVEAYVKSLQNKGLVVYYEAADNGIMMKLSTGLSMYYTPNVEGIDSVGSDVSMSVITYQPCRNMYDSLMNEYMLLPDTAAAAISNTFDNYTYSELNNYDNEEVSLEQIKSFGSNQIVLWHGHGGYTNSDHSLLFTGEDFNWNSWWWDISYWWDCVRNRIINSNSGRAVISAKYIEKYCNNMNNSFFYLACCESGKDNVLANTFLNKGASAVIANTEVIYTVYNLLMENEVAQNLTQINPTTKNYYTLNEALNKAKVTYGDTDLEWFPGNDPKQEEAEPIIFGGLDANNYRLAEAVHKYEVFSRSDINSWEEAEAYCESLGGHLATISSQKENDYVYSIVKESGYSSAYFGLTDREIEGEWRWVTGEDVVYTNWHSGEPNAENSNEDYAMFYYKYADGTWNDGDFGGTTVSGGTAFICEWE